MMNKFKVNVGGYFMKDIKIEPSDRFGQGFSATLEIWADVDKIELDMLKKDAIKKLDNAIEESLSEMWVYDWELADEED